MEFMFKNGHMLNRDTMRHLCSAKVRSLFLGALVFSVLASGCARSAVHVPTGAVDKVDYVGVEFKIDSMVVEDGDLCAFKVDGEGLRILLIFPPGTTGSSNPPRIHTNGIDVSAGDRLNSGAHTPVEGGRDCGGEHYPDAVVVSREITEPGDA